MPATHPARLNPVFLLMLGALIGWLVPGRAMASDAGDPASRDRPNILFVYADDHAYQAISAYGSRINRTPNIDRLAREGMRFDNCFVTNSICGPMRAVVLTGKYSHRNGFYVNGNRFDTAQPTFAKRLRGAGYQTAVIGKWHLRCDPGEAGFGYYHVLNGQGPYYNPPMRTPKGRTEHTGYTTDVITDLTLKWLKERRDADRPFFLMYQHKAPHARWQPGPDHLRKYEGETIPEPATLFDDYSGRSPAAAVQDMEITPALPRAHLKLAGPPRYLTDEQAERWRAAYGPRNEAFREAGLEGRALARWRYQRFVKDYLRCVDSIDENLGRVLDYLDEAGLAEDTMVVYTSDQGFFLGEHGWFDKRWMYEQSLRTPLIVRWPGVVEPGRFNDEIVSPLDFAATFCEIAGVEAPAGQQGRSLLPLLKGRTPEDWREYFYYHYYEYPSVNFVRRHYGVTDGRYKLIRFYNLDAWELFDLKFDPNELHSVYDNAAYARVRKRMKQQLERLRRELGVPERDPRASFRGGRPNRRHPVPRRYRGLPRPQPPER